MSDSEVLAAKPRDAAAAPEGTLDMLPYHKLKLLAEAAGNPDRVHFANAEHLQEA
jgi:hypothetical protein